MCINGDQENDCFLYEPDKQTYGCYIVPVTTKEMTAENNVEHRGNIPDFKGNGHEDCCNCRQALDLDSSPDNTKRDVQISTGTQCGESNPGEIDETDEINKKQPCNCLQALDLDDRPENTKTNVQLINGTESNPSEIGKTDKINKTQLCSSTQPGNHFDSSCHVAFDYLRNLEQNLGGLLQPKDPPPQQCNDFESYRGRVVTAVYMNKPTRYIVADIHYDMSPLSPFPDPEVAPTFLDYFKQRYGVEVRGDQPLLKVRSLSRVNNCLVSKYRDTKGRELPLPSKER